MTGKTPGTLTCIKAGAPSYASRPATHLQKSKCQFHFRVSSIKQSKLLIVLSIGASQNNVCSKMGRTRKALLLHSKYDSSCRKVQNTWVE